MAKVKVDRMFHLSAMCCFLQVPVLEYCAMLCKQCTPLIPRTLRIFSRQHFWNLRWFGKKKHVSVDNFYCSFCFLASPWKSNQRLSIAKRRPLFVSLPYGPHSASIAFRHLPPNSASIGYVTAGSFFISVQLFPDAVNALREVWVLIRLWMQHSVKART